MTIEIVDFFIENGGSFHSYVSLPEGNMVTGCSFLYAIVALEVKTLKMLFAWMSSDHRNLGCMKVQVISGDQFLALPSGKHTKNYGQIHHF
jgi:hypothetical protein